MFLPGTVLFLQLTWISTGLAMWTWFHDHPIDPESVLILCGKATIHCDPGHVLGADVALVASEQTDPECGYKYREDSCQKADLSSKLSNCLWNNSSCSVEPSGFCVIHSPSFLIPTFDHVAVFRNICVPVEEVHKMTDGPMSLPPTGYLLSPGFPGALKITTSPTVTQLVLFAEQALNLVILDASIPCGLGKLEVITYTEAGCLPPEGHCRQLTSQSYCFTLDMQSNSSGNITVPGPVKIHLIITFDGIGTQGGILINYTYLDQDPVPPVTAEIPTPTDVQAETKAETKTDTTVTSTHKAATTTDGRRSKHPSSRSVKRWLMIAAGLLLFVTLVTLLYKLFHHFLASSHGSRVYEVDRVPAIVVLHDDDYSTVNNNTVDHTLNNQHLSKYQNGADNVYSSIL